MATEKITIVIDEKGSVVVKKNVKELGTDLQVVDKRVQSTTKSLTSFRSVLAGLTTGLSAAALINYADSATRLGNTLRNAGLEGQTFLDVQESIYQAGIKNGQNAEQLGAIYQKLAVNQEALGATGQDVLDVTTGVAAAMRMSSAGAAAQEGALQQLSQSFGGLKVQAQEFNSLIDGAYPLLQAAANGSERWGGSVAKLSQDVKNSNVYTKEFFDALKIGLKGTVADAQNMQLTIGQAFQSIQTAFTRWIANSENATGASAALANAMSFLANNMDSVMNVVVPLVTIIGVNFAITAVGAAISAVTTLTTGFLALSAAFLASPIGMVTALIVGATTALYLLLDAIFAGNEAWEGFKQSAVDAVVYVKDVLSSIFTFGNEGAKIEIKADEAAATLTDVFDTGSLTLRGGVETGGTTAAGTMKAGLTSAGEVVSKTWYEMLTGWLGDLADWFGSFFKSANPTTGNKALDGEDTKNAAKTLGAGVKDGSKTGAKTMGAGVSNGGTSAANAMNDGITHGGTSAGSSMNDGTTEGGNNAGNSMKRGTQEGGAGAAATIKSAMLDAGRQIAQMIRSAAASAAKSGGGGGDYGNTALGALNASSDAMNAQNDGSRFVKTPTDWKYYQFARGGQFRVGGNGGTDSQHVAFKASPDERVTVETPAQQRRSDAAPVASSAGSKPVTIINNYDPRASIDSLKTREGNDTILNNMRSDPGRYRAALGLA